MKNELRMMAMSAALLILSACGNLTPLQQVGANIVIQQATARFIEYKPTMVDRSVRATEIARIAGLLKAVAAGEETTIADLQARALTIVESRANLQPSDKVLANTLIAAVGEYLKEKVTDGTLKPADRLKVEDVLTQIYATCQFYIIGGAQPARDVTPLRGWSDVEARAPGAYPWRSLRAA